MNNRGSDFEQYRGRKLDTMGVGNWTSTGVGFWAKGGRILDIAMIFKY